MSASSGINYYIQQINSSVGLFDLACNEVVSNVKNGKIAQPNAIEEYKKVEQAFKQVLGNIEAAKPFLIDGEYLKEGAELYFTKLTSLDGIARRHFSKAVSSLQSLDPSLAIKTAEIFSGQKEDPVSYLHVYYNGPGELFIRGEGAHIRMPSRPSGSLSQRYEIGETKQLSWDEGIPLTREADCLWKAALVANERNVLPKYKFLVSDCTWSKGENYSSLSQSIVHVPVFIDSGTSLLIPMDVGFGNKLVLVGKGDFTIKNIPLELNWDERIDLDNIGPNLWLISFQAKEGAKYKICLAKDGGKLLWENGEDRIPNGKEVLAVPNFGEGICRAESMEIACANLGLHLLEQQDSVKEQRKEENAQKKAQVTRRPNPGAHDGKGFPDKSILRVNEFNRIEAKQIEGVHFEFYYTKNNKVSIMQANVNGCTAGASAMLIVDNGKLPKAADMVNRTGANYAEVAQDIRNAGLEPLIIPVASYGRSLQKLKEQIEQHGPAYIRIKEPHATCGHAIVVDEISSDLKKVRIRDTGHAWEIILDGEVFKAGWYGSMDQKRDTVGNTMETWDHTVQVKNGAK